MENKTKTAGKTATESVGVTETQKYKQAWYSHLQHFGRLKWNLKEVQVNKLDEVLNQLSNLIDQATENLQEERKNGN